MPKCEISIDARADTKLDISVDEVNSGVKKTLATVNGLSQDLELLAADPKAGIGLTKVCGHKLTTENQTRTEIINVSIPLPGAPDYSGTFTIDVKLVFTIEFFSDCSGPWCCKGKLKDIELTLVDFEREITALPDYTLAKATGILFRSVTFDDGCNPPEWVECCKHDDVEVTLKVKKHVVIAKPQPLLLTIKGKAKLDYSIWHKLG